MESWTRTLTQPKYIKRLEVLGEIDGLRVLVDARNNSRLIIVCPRLEEWLLESAKEAGVSVENFQLPKDPQRLHAEINLNPRKLEKFVRELAERSGRMETLRKFLSGEI